MKISHTLSWTSLALCVIGSPAYAGSVFKPFTPITNNTQANNYLGASIGAASSDDICADVSHCDNSDKAWKAFAGMRLNENLVLEGGYNNLGSWQAQDTNGQSISQDVTAFTAAGVVGIPMNDQIEVFAKAGAARWSSKHKDATGNQHKKTGTDVLIGAGASYDLGDNVGVRAEWERFKDVGDTSTNMAGDVDFVSVGVTFSSL